MEELRGSVGFCGNVPKGITQKVVAQMLSLNFLVWNIIYIYINMLWNSITEKHQMSLYAIRSERLIMFHFAFLFWNIMEHLEHYAYSYLDNWYQTG